MKFQFSIARLLMATAMVALTFGLARMMLDKQISSYAIFIGVLAADLGLIVLVAQKRSDLYRILNILVVVLGTALIMASVCLWGEVRSSWIKLVLLALGISMIPLFIFLKRQIAKAEANEMGRDGLEEMKAETTCAEADASTNERP
jgi:hypothetical protein